MGLPVLRCGSACQCRELARARLACAARAPPLSWERGVKEGISTVKRLGVLLNIC